MSINSLHNKVWLLTLSIFLSLNIFCQSNFLPGKITKLNGDIEEGLINVRNWKNNPKQISFKSSKNAQPISYNPIDLEQFYVNRATYVSGIIEVSTDYNTINQLEEGSEVKTKIDTVFLEAYYIGGKSLFSFKDFNGSENFYILQSNGFELLHYKKYLELVNDPYDLSPTLKKSVIKENKRYIRQLASYLNDCPTIYTEIQGLKYNKNSISELFKAYYNCSSSIPDFQKSVEKFSFKFGVFSGISFTSINYNSNSFKNIVGTNFSNSTNFTGGLFFELIFPKTRKRWSFNNEIIFSSYRTKGQYLEFIHDERFTLSTTKIGYSYIKLNNLVRYKYPIKKFKTFINIGLSNGFAIKEINYRLQEITFFSSFRVEEGLAVQKAKKYEQGIILGFGTSYRNISLELRYESGTGNSPVNTLSSKVNRYSILIGYNF